MTEENGSKLRDWLNTVLIGACGALIAALWLMLQGQFTGIGTSLSDMRADVKVLQTQAIDQKMTAKELEGRIQNLVNTINDCNQIPTGGKKK